MNITIITNAGKTVEPTNGSVRLVRKTDKIVELMKRGKLDPVMTEQKFQKILKETQFR